MIDRPTQASSGTGTEGALTTGKSSTAAAEGPQGIGTSL